MGPLSWNLFMLIVILLGFKLVIIYYEVGFMKFYEVINGGEKFLKWCW